MNSRQRTTRVLLTNKDSEIKDKIFMKLGFDETHEFYTSLGTAFGETLALQVYVDNIWITRFQKSSGRLQEINTD